MDAETLQRLDAFSKKYAQARKALEAPTATASFHGIPILIDRPRGHVQTGFSPAGKLWTRVYGFRRDGTPVDGFLGYGEIPGTSGGDGEPLDVYLGSDGGADMAYLIHQGAPDPEHKLMLGWSSESKAIDAYLAHTPPELLTGVTPVPVALIQSLLGVVEKSADRYVVRLEKAARHARIQKAQSAALEYLEWRAQEVPLRAPPGFAHIALTAPLTGVYDGGPVAGWRGWIEPQGLRAGSPRTPLFYAVDNVGVPETHRSGDWIAFVGVDGRCLLWTSRRDDGTVVGTPILFERTDLAEPEALAARRLVEAQKAAPARHTIEIECGGDSIESIKKVLRVLQRMGQIGHSTPLYYEHDGIRSMGGFDGDGSSRIAKILINGEEIAASEENVPTRGVPVGYLHELTAEQKARYETVANATPAELEAMRAEHVTKSEKAEPFKIEAEFVSKALDDDLRYVLGIVLEPLDPSRGEADTQGDSYTKETIRKAMWGYMMYFRNVSLNHKAFLNGRVYVVECWQTDHDFTIDGTLVRAGTWLLGLYIPDDDVWGMVKRRELRGLSIAGVAERVPLAA